MIKEFDLSDLIFKCGKARAHYGLQVIHKENVKEFIKILEKYVNDARMYADMDEPEFWASSTISPQDAEKRAKYLEEFIEFIKKKAGEKLK